MVSIKFRIIQPVSPSREATIEIEAKLHMVSSFTSLSISKLFTSASETIWKPQRGPQLFDTYNEPTTCISAEPHEQAVKDPVQHYFGCIEICQRPDFFQESNHVWVNEREIERKKLRMAMDNAPRPLSTDDINARLNETMTKRMLSVAIAIEARYKRTNVMRSAIMKLRSSGGQPSLIFNVDRSRDKWMSSQEFKNGIPRVRNWRKGAQGGHRPVDPVNAREFTLSDRIQTGRQEVRLFIRQHGINKGQNPDLSDLEYSIERDVHAHLIEFNVQEASIQASSGADSSSTGRQFLKPANNELTDVGVKGTFPDQRISISRLLNNGRDLKKEQCDPKGDWNVLRRDRNEGFAKPRRIRYLHVPSNNMAWVEKIIANYYADSNPDVRSKVQSPGIQSSTQLLLRPQYWHGQQQGTRSGIVHARHMRPLCEMVSSDTGKIEQSSKNIALFMPYLHWETNRARQTISRMIDGKSDRQRQKDRAKKELQRLRRVESRSELARPGTQKKEGKNDPKPTDRKDQKHFLARARRITNMKSLTSTVELLLPRGVNANVGIDETGRLQVSSELGQYLIDAARLFEAMSMMKDRQMVEQYLFHEAPLHPRRTLRQCINRGFKSTVSRDQDQTVCQETSCDAEPFYKFVSLPHDFMGLGQRIIIEIDKAKQLRLQRLSTARPLTEHHAYDDHYGCEECRQNIMQVQRLIMVDQIWMWILDEQTIITSFPQSWQRNAKQTINGIHESIRARLRPLVTTEIDDQVQSIYESQFQVLDTFSEVIGRVKLQQELREAMDDLDVMIDIHDQQKDIIRRFCQYAEHNLSPEEEKLRRFREQSKDLLYKLGNQQNELQRLRKWAQSTAEAMDDLIFQKQQQASLVQAWESARQADESTSQGRAIMLFTVVTIVFVPLSFISSIFGMNNIEFTGQGPMTLNQQFKLMCTVIPRHVSQTFVWI
ncbi:hypothetical protein GE21DRAFT_3573 [Neurospora crassa]|uniref:Uncharacterized protein n=1 Tax=Neurospora crassa (strain ATCC 24698 / 74-OR23-1A / CBS 708.71 / DSM 1257 / FGSC 987) TaxID=367110 RepID=Q7SCG8_NEUCR|nr:hypothetical protein NCU08697 [Neurospora crassa OR74A]EAA34322.3 hypothetical protein NCU08697 [Neurospora crassa OR74A]KHE82926.1 hypothetical protein GE21DRAFT_3573 [Neurospora crassa]|eukprot:XP_963558.3 hypothetical protein NCU08697 [Neurospora crassa OR74A]